MKKLMMAVAIVCAAVCAQAAQVTWTGYTYINDGNADSDWYDGQAYLIYITDAEAFNITDELVITGGSIVDNVDISGGEFNGTLPNSDGIFGASGTKAFAILATTDGVDENLPTSGTYGVYQGTFEYVFEAGGAIAVPSSFNEGSIEANTAVTPEPTSGLLLLIGMAGLALRRRRT